jgi:hypothetical protein
MKIDVIAKEFPANRVMTKGPMHHRLGEGHEVVSATSGAGEQ